MVSRPRCCCHAACRYQSKKAAAAASDDMDPELRVVMLGGRDNEGASGMLQLMTRGRTCHGDGGPWKLCICCTVTLLQWNTPDACGLAQRRGAWVAPGHAMTGALPVMAVAMLSKHQESYFRSMASICVLHKGYRRRSSPYKGLVNIVDCHGFCQIPSWADEHQPHRHMRHNEACPCKKQGPSCSCPCRSQTKPLQEACDGCGRHGFCWVHGWAPGHWGRPHLQPCLATAGRAAPGEEHEQIPACLQQC